MAWTQVALGTDVSSQWWKQRVYEISQTQAKPEAS